MDAGAQRPGFESWEHQPGAAVGARRSTLVLGASGTGKTIFALQALVSAAHEREPGLFVGIGQEFERLLRLGQVFGWDLPRLQAEKLLAIHTPERGETLTRITADALVLAEKFRATRVAMDALHLAASPEDTAEHLRELLQVRDTLFAHGLTSTFTCSTAADAVTRWAALMQSLAECTVWLEVQHDLSGLKRLLRVVKYRAAPFPHWEFPFAIGPRGIELSVPGEPATSGPFGPELKAELDVAKQRLTTGLHALDRFLEIKQAELDFLLQKDTQQAPAPEPEKLASRSDPLRPGAQEI